VHHVGIVLAGEDITSPAHIGCKLVDFIEGTIDHVPYEIWITQIADQKVIRLRLAKTWKLEISAPNPKSFPLEPTDQVVTDESAGPTDQRNLSHSLFPRHAFSPCMLLVYVMSYIYY
jgi:hypothetical protein